MASRQSRIKKIQRLQKIQEMQEQLAARQAPSEEEQAPEQQAPGSDVSQMEAAAMGAVQGASFHMADEVSAGIDTTKEVLKSVAAHYNEIGAKGITDALPNIKETYNARLEQERLLLEQARKKHPASFTTGEIAGSLLSTTATFGAGSIVGAGGFLASTGGSLIAGGAISAAHGFGSSEEETIAGMLEDTAKAAALGAAGDVAGRAVGTAVQPLAKAALDKVSTSTLLRFLKVNKGTATNSLQKYNKQIDDWAQRILGYKNSDGKKLVNVFESRSTMLEKVEAERAFQGNGMGSVLDEIDTNFTLKIDHDAMYDDIVESIFEGKQGLRRTMDIDEEQMAQKLKEKVYRMFFKKQKLDPKTKEVINPREPREDINLTMIHRYVSRTYKKAMKGLRSQDPETINYWQARKDVADTMSDHLDNIINTSGELKKSDLYAKYSAHREAYGDLKEAEKLLAKSLKDDPAEGFLNEVFSNGVNKFLIAAGSLGSNGGLPGGEWAAAIGALRALGQNRSFNAMVGKSAKIIADAIESDPNKFGRIGSRLMVSSSLGGKALLDDIMMSSAQVDLMKQPVARSTKEVIRRQDSILTVIDGINKSLAKKLRAAIKSGNDAEISGIMSQISAEDTAGIIEKGLGWEGKAVTESDKQAVESWLKSISNAKKRMILTKKFQDEQMIPEEMTNPQIDVDPVNKFVKPAAKRLFNKPKDLGY